MVAAYSYIRFSSPQQATGDSVRRQTEATADWCRRHGTALDTSLRLRDEGVSAFKGKNRQNPDVHGLAAFLSAVQSGRVEPGSYLLLENLDRLTREAIVPATNLFTSLLLAGVKVVQLQPHEQVFTDGSDMTSIMLALVELSRGHSESAMKSKRVGAAWANKRKTAATQVVTRKLPGWVVYDEKTRTLALDPAKAATVRRLFDLAREGHGVADIARRLNADRVAVLGRTEFKGRPVQWNETVVYHILTSRATIGEFQPHKGRGSDRTPSGPPVPNYFPPVIDADTFHATRAVMKARAKVGRGRRGSHVNLFSGLLIDARDGGTLTYKHLGGRPATLIPVGAKQGRNTKWASFPAEPFERAVLSELTEVKPRDVFAKEAGANKADALEGQLAEVDGLLATWKAKMDDPRLVEAVAEKLAELGGRRKALAAELEAARMEAAEPAADAWGRFRSLAALLANDKTEDTRVAVRTALRRTVESVTCLFTGKGRIRLAAVRVQFRGTNQHRDYVVAYSPGRSNHLVKRSGQLWHQCAAWVDEPGELDLRKLADAAKVEKLLRALDVSGLAGE
jgi:DNA invertase Pin-like site-specific DNA recombinase